MPKITPTETKADFLRLVANGVTSAEAAKACGFGVARPSTWSKASPDFAEALAKAKEEGKRARRIRAAQQTRTFLAALAQEAAPAAAPAPVPTSSPALPTVRPIALGIIKGDVFYVEPSQLARVLDLARSAAG